MTGKKGRTNFLCNKLAHLKLKKCVSVYPTDSSSGLYRIDSLLYESGVFIKMNHILLLGVEVIFRDDFFADFVVLPTLILLLV